MSGGRRSEVRFRCPNCGALAGFEGEYRPELVALCGKCGRDVTKEFKKAFFRGVAADINARLVERENREFLKELMQHWKDGGSGGPKRKR